MASVDTLIDWLANGPTPDCDQILGAALEHAQGPDFDRFVSLLFSRNTIAAWAALIANYDRLDASRRQELQQNESLWRSGIAGAFKQSTAARLAALTALADQPSVKLAYLIPHALRDSAGRCRDAAAQAFRRIAETAWLSAEQPQDAVAAREAAADRAQFLQTLQGLLRTFDRHHRVELVEVCLWFADELGSVLWEILENPRTRLNRVVQEHLERWNGPKLLKFLLTALTRSDWRLPVLRMLRVLEGPEVGLALLRCAGLLENPEIGRAVANLRKSGWYSCLDSTLDRVPQELRPLAPWLLLRAGLEDAAKLRLLSQWAEGQEESVRRAAVYALARIESAEAVLKLAHLARGDGPKATFAKWYLSGRKWIAAGGEQTAGTAHEATVAAATIAG